MKIANELLALCGPSALALFLVLPMSGCGTNSGGQKEQDFFTSGSREADQRASQRMAKHEQLAGSKEGGVKEAKPAEKTESGEPQAARAQEKLTLYDRLGGQERLSAIVEDFVPRVLADPRVNWERAGVSQGGFLFGRNRSATWKATPQNVALLTKHLVQFLALATGGPPKYEGREMKAVHEGMEITNTEFDAAVGDLKASLDRLQVPDREQKELLAIMESTRPQVVTKR